MRYIAQLFFFMFVLSAYGQREIYIPYRVDNKWAVADTSGSPLFKAKYKTLYPADHNRIRFEEKGKFGFIDSNGNIAIEPIYDEAIDFFYLGGTRSRVAAGDSSFYIDKNGDIAQPVFGCGNRNGQKLFESGGTYEVEGKYGLLGKEDTLTAPKYKSIETDQYRAFAIVEDFEGNLGLIRYNGKTIFSCNLDSVVHKPLDFQSDYYLIYQNEKVGAVDYWGNILAYPKYDHIERYDISFHCFLAFRNGKELGYVYQGKEYWE